MKNGSLEDICSSCFAAKLSPSVFLDEVAKRALVRFGLQALLKAIKDAGRRSNVTEEYLTAVCVYLKDLGALTLLRKTYLSLGDFLNAALVCVEDVRSHQYPLEKREKILSEAKHFFSECGKRPESRDDFSSPDTQKTVRLVEMELEAIRLLRQSYNDKILPEIHRLSLFGSTADQERLSFSFSLSFSLFLCWGLWRSKEGGKRWKLM